MPQVGVPETLNNSAPGIRFLRISSQPLAAGIPPHRWHFLRWMRFSRWPWQKRRLAICETVAPAGIQKERGRREA